MHHNFASFLLRSFGPESLPAYWAHQLHLASVIKIRAVKRRNAWLIHPSLSIMVDRDKDSFSQSQVFGQDGELIASCSQQCVFRAAPGVLDEEDGQQGKVKL